VSKHLPRQATAVKKQRAAGVPENGKRLGARNNATISAQSMNP